MVVLSSAGDEVVMLLVAGGVGLLGGIGAALLEWKLNSTAPTTPKPKGFWAVVLSVLTAIFLGGVAAVALVYFVSPVKEIVEEAKTVSEWEVRKLVPLSLLVGTAGTAFIQAMQTRALSTLNAARAETTEVTAKAEVAAVGSEATKATQSGIEESTDLKSTLEAHGVASKATDEVLGAIAEQAALVVKEKVDSQVEASKKTIAAAAALPGSDPNGGSNSDF